MYVVPLADKLVVELPEKVEKIGSIFIPDQAKEEKSEGIVIAVGPGRIAESGALIPVRVSVGDKVAFGKWAGDDIDANGRRLKILKEVEILAIIREEEPTNESNTQAS